MLPHHEDSRRRRMDVAEILIAVAVAVLLGVALVVAIVFIG